MALNRPMIQRNQGMTQNGTMIPAGDPMAMMRLGRESVEADRRTADDARRASGLGPSMSLSLPDSAWDGFFGAINNRQRLVQQAGGRFGLDVGSIGRTKARDEITGHTYDVQGGEMPPGYGRKVPVPEQLNPSSRNFSHVALAGLQRAMGR
jgi:hypothetical protein